MFSPFVNIFCLKHAYMYTSHILFYISHGLHFSATKYLKTDLCSNLENFVWLAVILNNILKTNAFVWLK